MLVTSNPKRSSSKSQHYDPYFKTKSFLKKLFPSIKIRENPQVDFSTETNYYIKKPKFWQKIDFSQTKLILSKYAKSLLQYFIGAFNHWGKEVIFKSYRELREELLLSRYAIDIGIKELSSIGIINRSCYGFKNKSHWSLDLIAFSKASFKIISQKVSCFFDKYLNNLKRSANSYSRELIDNNKYSGYKEIERTRTFDLFKKHAKTYFTNNFIQVCSSYEHTRRMKMGDAYEEYSSFRKSPEYYGGLKQNYGSKFEKKIPQIEEISEMEKVKRKEDGLSRQAEANRRYFDIDPYGVVAKSKIIERETCSDGSAQEGCLGFMKKLLGIS